MQAFTKLKDGQRIVSSAAIALPHGGSIVTEVIGQDQKSFIVGTIHVAPNGVVTKALYCGYCDGVLIGCVDCPNNQPFLNCATRTVSCW